MTQFRVIKDLTEEAIAEADNEGDKKSLQTAAEAWSKFRDVATTAKPKKRVTDRCGLGAWGLPEWLQRDAKHCRGVHRLSSYAAVRLGRWRGTLVTAAREGYFHEGWIMKKGGTSGHGRRNWKKRWCQLKDHRLNFYTSPEEAEVWGGLLPS